MQRQSYPPVRAPVDRGGELRGRDCSCTWLISTITTAEPGVRAKPNQIDREESSAGCLSLQCCCIPICPGARRIQGWNWTGPCLSPAWAKRNLVSQCALWTRLQGCKVAKPKGPGARCNWPFLRHGSVCNTVRSEDGWREGSGQRQTLNGVWQAQHTTDRRIAFFCMTLGHGAARVGQWG